jgi:hypothetical protein
LDFSVFLDELTRCATSARKDVAECITADSVPPAQIGPGDGLWKPNVNEQVPKEMRIINEPAVPIPPRDRIGDRHTIDSRDYTFRLAREGVRRVSQGGQIAACSANRHSSNSTLTRGLNRTVSWNTAGQ